MLSKEIINLYDEYTHKPLNRREFLERLTKLVGTSAAALAMLPILENNYAKAATIEENDKRLSLGHTKYRVGDKEITAYIAKPKGRESLASVLVIHENRGLNPHIMDIARRIALEGFLAIAPDALSTEGGTPKDEDKAREMISKLKKEDALGIYLEGVKFAKNHKNGNGKVGCLGFCWGGGVANSLSIYAEDLKCAISYYGMQPEGEAASKIRAPLQLHYAGLDDRINRGIAGFIASLSTNVEYQLNMYPNVNHAFNNDTNAARYDKAAATTAWSRSILFLKQYLG